MRLCAVAQHDPPELHQPLSAVSCDSSVLHSGSIVPRILRFLYVSLHQRSLRGRAISMTLLCLTGRFFQSSCPSSPPGQPVTWTPLWFHPSIIVSIAVQAL